MKKALVMFLILAVAGGLFAQVSFGGSVETGIGVGFDNQENDEGPKLDFIANRGEKDVASSITGKYTGEGDYGKYGAEVTISYNGGWQNLWKDHTPGYEGGSKIWWEPISIFRIELGNVGSYGFGSPAGLYNLLQTYEPGLELTLRPIDGLKIGTDLWINGDNASVYWEKTRYALGAVYSLAILDINGSLQLRPSMDPLGLYWGAGAKLKMIPGLGIAVDAAGYDFGNSKKNYLGFGGKVDFATGGLSLAAIARAWMAMGSDLESSFIPMLFQGEIGYKLSDVVSLGVQGRYTVGSKPSWNSRNAGDSENAPNGTGFFVKDNKDAGLIVSPEINFNVGPQIKLGWNIQMDMSDGAKASASAMTQQHLIYATVKVGF